MLFGRKADRRAEFDAVALPHLDELYRSARRMLGDPTRADDVVQDVYLRAWRSFETFEEGTNCRAWLFRILVNSVHDYRRRWLSRPAADDSEEILERREAPAPAADGLTDQQILEALGSLPESYRDAVILADVEEFRYKEIAEMLGVKIGTVMSRLSRGRRLLRERLRDAAKSYGVGSAGGAGAA